MVEDSKSLVTPLPGRAFIKKLIEEIEKTKYSLDVIQYQWNFYPRKISTSKGCHGCQKKMSVKELNRAVLEKARRGLKVRVLLNREGRSSHLTVINMEAKRYLSEAGISVKTARTFPTTHAKLWIFDHDAVILGSHNISNRSVTVNNEASALIKSREVAVEFKRYFDQIWKISG